MQKAGEACRSDCRLGLVLGLGTMCLGLGAACFVLFAPVMVAFMIYGLLLPIIQLWRLSDDSTSVLILPRVLSAGYLICIGVLGLLGPAVYRFQHMLSDVVDIRNMPPTFYSELSIRGEVSRRYVWTKTQRALEELLDTRGTHHITEEILETSAWRGIAQAYSEGILRTAHEWYVPTPGSPSQPDCPVEEDAAFCHDAVLCAVDLDLWTLAELQKYARALAVQDDLIVECHGSKHGVAQLILEHGGVLGDLQQDEANSTESEVDLCGVGNATAVKI